MSMAISRISASGVAAMLYPVTKPSRVAKVDSGNRANVVAAGTSSQAVQAISGSQTDTSSTPEQVHAAFQYTLAALSCVATGGASMAQSSPEAQFGGVQQAGDAYAQVEQQAGQTLDITA
jgi:hypothetical protein